MSAFAKLRINIEIEGDLTIAEREVRFFSKEYIPIYKEDISKVISLGFTAEQIIANSRKSGIIGYLLQSNINVKEIVYQASFIQEIWTTAIPDTIKDKPYCKQIDKGYCLVPTFALGEIISYLPKKEVDIDDAVAVVNYLAGLNKSNSLEKAVQKASTSTPHAHGLHKYKAKFFPRLIRSILTQEVNNAKNVTVLDPFVGSGTTLVESSFLGYKSIGIDIDKLSCLISESKSELLHTSVETIKVETAEYNAAHKNGNYYHFPSWISKKFERNNLLDEKRDFETEISTLVSPANKLKHSKRLFLTVVSDALTRKFNIRMMGTGAPRFALEIQKSSLKNIVCNNIEYLVKASSVIATLKKIYALKLPEPKVINGNATNLDIADKSIDIILTSPPYLPASSGREDYVIGKSISVTALGLLTEEQVKSIESNSVGSMRNNQLFSKNGLPESVYDLYNWLKNDELRSIKADPTYSYYLDIKKALHESYRVLKKGGKAIYVIGKESVFYSFKTRQILYKVECDNIFQQIAVSAGFSIKDKMDVELDKKNRNARPRSLDKYYETVFILEK